MHEMMYAQSCIMTNRNITKSRYSFTNNGECPSRLVRVRTIAHGRPSVSHITTAKVSFIITEIPASAHSQQRRDAHGVTAQSGESPPTLRWSVLTLPSGSNGRACKQLEQGQLLKI
jgi:hypothetical protein